jgi:hypothetical protein
MTCRALDGETAGAPNASSLGCSSAGALPYAVCRRAGRANTVCLLSLGLPGAAVAQSGGLRRPAPPGSRLERIGPRLERRGVGRPELLELLARALKLEGHGSPRALQVHHVGHHAAAPTPPGLLIARRLVLLAVRRIDGSADSICPQATRLSRTQVRRMAAERSGSDAARNADARWGQAAPRTSRSRPPRARFPSILGLPGC